MAVITRHSGNDERNAPSFYGFLFNLNNRILIGFQDKELESYHIRHGKYY